MWIYSACHSLAGELRQVSARLWAAPPAPGNVEGGDPGDPPPSFESQLLGP